MATYTASATSSSDSSSSNSGSSGSGSTHTVIVAPTQGVLRYVPFALNASVGDTVEFVWHANVHTVTHSSELEVCNKTLDDPFTSGIQNESFTFTQVINSTDPTFFYCGVPTHCQKGMFGIINPPSALVSNMSVGSMMPTMVSNVRILFILFCTQPNELFSDLTGLDHLDDEHVHGIGWTGLARRVVGKLN